MYIQQETSLDWFDDDEIINVIHKDCPHSEKLQGIEDLAIEVELLIY